MLYRSLGQTGLNVSAVGLGGVAFGGMYGTLHHDEADACVRRAIDLGINVVDTSPYYGKTRSEEVLGPILSRDGLRQKIFLSSKAGRNDVADFDFSAPSMRRSVEASLMRLQTDYLDILIAHDIEFAPNFDQVLTETADVLHELKREGKARFIGMSGLPLAKLQTAIEKCNLDVVMSYTHYTLQNQSLLSDLLPIANEKGVGLMNASPLCMGLLSDHGPPAWHPAPSHLKEAAHCAAERCRSRGVSLAFLGMQYCYAEPRIPITISGAARATEIESNIRALETPIDQQLLSEVQAIFEPVQHQSWPSGV
jgi:L-galactose dehydrogenase